MNTLINVGLNRAVRRNGRKRIEHRNIKIEIRASWDAVEFHDLVCGHVARYYRGWSITGYCLPAGRM